MESIEFGNLELAILGIGVLLLITLIWLFLVSRKLNKMFKLYKQMMGETAAATLEDAIIELQQTKEKYGHELKRHKEKLAELTECQKMMNSRVGICRYNAFAEQGSDLSFSLAIINEYQDGVVISGIHSRTETYMYAKPLEKGESNYTLSPEERKAINLALQQV